MWDLPGPGMEHLSPALAGGFLTTKVDSGPSKKPTSGFLTFLPKNFPSSIFPLISDLLNYVYVSAAAAKSLQSCLTLCDPMDSSLPGSSVHGIFQARVLEWGAIAFSDMCQHLQPVFPLSSSVRGGTELHNQDSGLDIRGVMIPNSENWTKLQTVSPKTCPGPIILLLVSKGSLMSQ